jgi:hypothetical protein
MHQVGVQMKGYYLLDKKNYFMRESIQNIDKVKQYKYHNNI